MIYIANNNINCIKNIQDFKLNNECLNIEKINDFKNNIEQIPIRPSWIENKQFFNIDELNLNEKQDFIKWRQKLHQFFLI